ncbi:amidohydrolase [Acutalibacter sp. 1XD8-33]|uniref:amidohydrolase family protein n=1 Tax=Acutalibacter sp. 1XD8-33 TaxID=2320081 RepID=UPI000EA27EB5|nr:amidohydrolase family protein [Acutalibacter sp. 1XD8-33]RKJ40355.1 amidohydrolase [Acutalibacter sp. 1XD8-33]
MRKLPVIHNGASYLAADAHAHIYPEKIAEKATASVGRFYDLAMRYVGTPGVLAEAGAQAGLDRFLVCSVATKVEQVRSINGFIESACREYPQFVGLGAWHPDVEDIEGELDDIQRQGLRGIKLHPDFQEFAIDDPKMLPFYRAAECRGLPILFHTGDSRKNFSSPRQLARVLQKLPGLTCVAAHLGGYTEWKAARECLRGSGVYVDTSSSFPFLSEEEALESIALFGADRVMFGTDFPMWPAGPELRALFALGLTQAENRGILFENFARLYRVSTQKESHG